MATLVPTRAAPVPPRPAPKPGHVKVVRAMYNYSAQNADELTFDEGDILYILDATTNPNWWKARCGQKTGLVPSNYVEDSMEEILNPLHDASKRGNLAFLQECLKNKVSANGLDKAGCTALHWACHGGHLDCVRELLKIPSIEINVQNKLGDTPLHNAAWKGHDRIVELLLNSGARTDLSNNEGKTPVDLARDPHSLSLLQPKTLKRSISHADEEYGSSEDSD